MENVENSHGEEIDDRRGGGMSETSSSAEEVLYWIYNSEEFADSWCKMLTRLKS